MGLRHPKHLGHHSDHGAAGGRCYDRGDKKFRDAWAAPALYGVAGGGIIFFCLWLPIQIGHQFDSMKRFQAAQTKALERLANEQKEELKKLSRKRVEEPAQPSKAKLDRPYFTLTKAEVQKVPKRGLRLSVSFKNNEIVAHNVISHLLAAPKSVESASSPIHTARIEGANPIGPGQPFIHQWSNINNQDIRRTRFIVIQIRYTDSRNNKTYSQPIFLKFGGVAKDGTFEKALFHANNEEKAKLVKYMERRGIAKMKGDE